MARRLRYWRRVFSAYLGRRRSHLTFWHETPEANDRALPGELGEYWQLFASKADYPGPYDDRGIPLLDYHGQVGLRYNPIAVAQYGLGNYNLFRRSGDPTRKQRWVRAAEWLVDNLEENAAGLPVWNHHFDWEYRIPLRSPWYSALSQGQGISLLVRAHRETGDARYREAAAAAWEAFLRPLEAGGVSHRDEAGYLWFEETVVDPPTHILNGFLWAAWGVYDFALHTRSAEVRALFDEAVRTLRDNLHRFDLGYWSLYDLPGTRLPNPASAFYHALHAVQLRIMHRLTGEERFRVCADRWHAYGRSAWRRKVAWGHKALFKLIHY